MLPRGTIDISRKELLSTILKSFIDWKFPKRKNKTNCKVRECELVTLSVRTGLDLVLTDLNLPEGSEVIVNSVNISDMFLILKHHKLVLVPVKTDIATLNVDISEIEKKITSKTKIIFITHLFGASLDLRNIAELAENKKIFFMEDRAQAFTGSFEVYNYKPDVMFFSFGLTKTCSALSGAIVRFKDELLCKNIAVLQEKLPVYSRKNYFKKSLKGLVIKFMTRKLIYSAIFRVCKILNIDFDQMLSSKTKGFPGNDLFEQIRFRPTKPIVDLVKYKSEKFAIFMLDKRSNYGKNLLKKIPAEIRIGYDVDFHKHWIVPVRIEEPKKFIKFLHDNNFDSTATASRLIKCPVEYISQQNDLADIIVDKIVYLPNHPSGKDRDLTKLARLINIYHS